MAEPTALHVEAHEHRRIELLAGAVSDLAVGVDAARGEGGGQLQDLLPLAEVAVEISEAVLGGFQCQRRCGPARPSAWGTSIAAP